MCSALHFNRITLTAELKITKARQGGSLQTSQEAVKIIQAGNISSIDQVAKTGGGDMQLDSGYVLKGEPEQFAASLDVGMTAIEE